MQPGTAVVVLAIVTEVAFFGEEQQPDEIIKTRRIKFFIFKIISKYIY